MLKTQYLVVLCKLAGRADVWAIASISEELGLTRRPSTAHFNAVRRLGSGVEGRGASVQVAFTN